MVSMVACVLVNCMDTIVLVEMGGQVTTVWSVPLSSALVVPVYLPFASSVAMVMLYQVMQYSEYIVFNMW